ncbi:MAG: efflux RND transporter periplasmic adaptor subunit [Burkholderiales bacterium]|nr:efflux RND transporter periplasmic adaptor subunit [Burkholderiales bacterium]
MDVRGELARVGWLLTSPERGASRARLWLAAGVAFLSALFAVGLWPRWEAVRAAQADTPAQSVQTVVYVHAEPGKGKHELSLPANVRAFQEAMLYARTNGYLKRWLVDIGDGVRAGQLLAEIEVPEADRELDEARARVQQVSAHLDLARITAERYRDASRDEAVSPQELDEKLGAERVRQADLAAAKAQVQRLEHMRAYQRVTAPFPGTIVARNVEIGTLVQAGSAAANGWLFKLSQTDRMRVQVNVPQNYAHLVKPGMEAELRVRELGTDAFPAKVERTAGAFDHATRTLLVELLVPNPQRRLLPGMYGQVQFHVVDPHPNVVIPVTALIVSGDGLQVAVLDARDAVRLRKVKVLRDLGREVEVSEGLAVKERVINNPRDTLQAGQQVRAVLQEKPADRKDTPKAGVKPADKAKT